MSLLAVIGAGLELILLIVKKWFSLDAERKETVKLILKDVPNAKSPKDITRAFDRINRL